MSASGISRPYAITFTSDCFARWTMLPADATSTALITMTFAPFVIAASACCCCFAGSWFAFA